MNGGTCAAGRHTGRTWYTAPAVDAKSLHTLELPKILERLAGHAAFSASAEAARALLPSADLETARRRLGETSEARDLLRLKPDLTVGAAHDVRPSARAATRGATLEPTDLLAIKSTLIAGRTLARLFEKLGDSHPALTALAAGIEICPGLIDAVSRTLDEGGEVLDGASPELAAIRRELRTAQGRLLEKLQRMLGDPRVAPLLQETLITQREGRFVLPLRAEFKGRLKAVVHDQSASGATLFVEPLGTVELNNRVRELELAERDEVRRILQALSAQVGEQAGEVARTVEALAALDLAFAKARYAEALGAHAPALRSFADGRPGHPGSRLRLLAARHPLLPADRVVPIDLDLDAETYALVITGPNTGGKTVTLKTAGLLALMAACGLHLPAGPDSELSIFDAVFADIGDEQSIEQSLSTFSSHITQAIRILEAATPRSLVLLDELGAGTDPQEGAALARALLEAFLHRPVTVLVATHYPELKTYAHAAPGARNASVEFDLETLRPTYRLTVGLPGRSNALAIAERIGLPAPIVEDARRLVSPDELRAEGLLDEIHRQREQARRAAAEAEQARGRAAALELELRARLDAIEHERRETLERARAQAADETEAVREELKGLRRRLAAAAQPLEALQAVERELRALEQSFEQPVARRPSEGEPPPVFRLGEKVRLTTLAVDGVITGLDDEQAEVQVGRLRVRARFDELARPAAAAAGRRPHRAAVSADTARPAAPEALSAAPPFELDLRGRLVDEALEALERRLDAACLAGLPFVRVIHGKGSGRLRQAVRQALRDNPYVASFESGQESEGGEGVTVVRLAVA